MKKKILNRKKKEFRKQYGHRRLIQSTTITVKDKEGIIYTVPGSNVRYRVTKLGIKLVDKWPRRFYYSALNDASSHWEGNTKYGDQNK